MRTLHTDTMLTLSTDEAAFITAMRDVVREAGADHVYDQREVGLGSEFHCTYVNWRDGGTTPSCLIGRALVRSGLSTVYRLREVEGQAASFVVPWDKTDPISLAADAAQETQDSGSTWGIAYGQALNTLTDEGYDVSAFAL